MKSHQIAHKPARPGDRQRDGRDLSMGLSMNSSLSMPLQTGQTALTAAIQAWDRSVSPEQATCKAVVGGSSPPAGSGSDQALLRPVTIALDALSMGSLVSWPNDAVLEVGSEAASAPAAAERVDTRREEDP